MTNQIHKKDWSLHLLFPDNFCPNHAKIFDLKITKRLMLNSQLHFEDSNPELGLRSIAD